MIAITVDYIWYFFIYSFMGWVCECVYCGVPAKKFINRGFLAGPICPIYGTGAVFIIALLKPVAGSIPLVFFLGMIITSAIEYVSSWGMEKLFRMSWWDYSNRPFNLNGRICLKNSLLFGVLCVVLLTLVHPKVLIFMAEFSPALRMWLAAGVTVYFISDMYVTVVNTIRLSGKLPEIEFELTKLRDRIAANIAEDIAETMDALAALDLTLRFTNRRLLDAFPDMDYRQGDAMRHLRDLLASGREARKKRK